MKKFVHLMLLAFVLVMVYQVTSAQNSQGVGVAAAINLTLTTDKNNYQIGELLNISLDVSADAYVYLFHVDASGSVFQLFPNFYAQDNLLSAGQHSLPNQNAFEFVLGPPSGSQFLQGVAASRPIDFGVDASARSFVSLGSVESFQNRLESALSAALNAGAVVNSAFANFSISSTPTSSNRSPIASFNYTPAASTTGQEILFDASASFDPDGQINQYQWDFNGDGITDTSGVQVRASFPSGTFPVTLTVSDNQGTSNTRTKTINVQSAINQPPLAVFSISNSRPSIGDLVLFDASASMDFDGSISQYLWDFNGDGRTDATGQRAVTRYESTGNFQVNLTVIDNQGLSATVAQTVTVQGFNNTPPVASFTITPTNPRVGELVTLNAAASRDPDGFVAQYQWDFQSDGVIDATGVIVRVRYENAGFARIRLTVTDNLGLSSNAEQNIQVRASSQPPQASFTFSPSPITVGEAVIFDGTNSFDTDGFISQYLWDFNGDNITDLSGPRVATRFNNAGTFRVVLTVVDNQGLRASSEQFVQVNQAAQPQPPRASFTFSPDRITTGQPVTFNASGSTDPDGTIVDYRWDFNTDGNIDAVGMSVITQFNTATTFRVTLTVVDNDGLSNSTSQNVTVNAPPPPPIVVTSGVQDVIWKNIINLSVSGNNLLKNNGIDGEWDAGASSVQIIESGNAFVETTVNELNTRRMVGLSKGDNTANFQEIDFAAFLHQTNALKIYENGVLITETAPNFYQVGDVVRVEVDGNDVVYLHNGVPFHTSTNAISPSSYPLLVDASIDTLNATLINVRFGIAATPSVPAPIVVTSGVQDVIWKNVVNLSVSGNNLLKNNGIDGEWDAGASSVQIVESGNAFVETTVNELNTRRMVGLSKGDNTANFQEIDFAAFLHQTNALKIYENGVLITETAPNFYQVGDVVRVEVNGSDVFYLHNGVPFHTSTNVINANSYPLLVDASIDTLNATLVNVRFGISTTPPTPPPAPVPSSGPIPLGLPGVFISGETTQLHIIVQGDTAWTTPRDFTIELETNTALANPTQQAQGPATGNVSIPSGSNVTITGTVGSDGRIDFFLDQNGPPGALQISTSLSGGGAFIVKDNQRFGVSRNPFVLAASPQGDVAAFPFAGKTIFVCSTVFNNGSFQSCEAVE